MMMLERIKRLCIKNTVVAVVFVRQPVLQV